MSIIRQAMQKQYSKNKAQKPSTDKHLLPLVWPTASSVSVWVPVASDEYNHRWNHSLQTLEKTADSWYEYVPCSQHLRKISYQSFI